MLKNHDLVEYEYKEIIYEKKPCLGPDGKPVEGLFNAWIYLNNPKQFNSYTTAMVKEVILAFRQASHDRSVNCVVFTAVGTMAFCTGGNTKEYAEYYSGNPQEYRQYMRLFNDMVTGILHCDKPVICRVNGMRIAGGQEIGMACDFTIASDLARFGQAGPKHGSAAIGGATDFLPLLIGGERAMESGTLCEIWSAHKAQRVGMIMDIAPALKVDGEFVPNPLVITDRYLDEYGRIIHGESKSGDELKEGKAVLKQGEVDLSLLDEKVEALCTKLMLTFPECMAKSVEQLRKPKLAAWQGSKEDARAWLALNMMAEAKTGFQAFNEGNKETGREIDFIQLRQELAKGRPWSDELQKEVSPQYK